MSDGYDEWYRKVDQVCWSRYGLSVNDLEDACWADFYEDGLTPREAVSAAAQHYD